jgi:hypothetical protein
MSEEENNKPREVDENLVTHLEEETGYSRDDVNFPYAVSEHYANEIPDDRLRGIKDALGPFGGEIIIPEKDKIRKIVPKERPDMYPTHKPPIEKVPMGGLPKDD